jgi:aldehyde dehydrogenase (NAD+)
MTTQHQTFNPANPTEMVAQYDLTQPADVNDLIERAKVAQAQWAKLPALQRIPALSAFLDAVEKQSDALARSITREQGKPIAESRGEVAKSLGESRVMIARAGEMVGQMMPSARPGVTCYTTRRPRGIVLGITPWNFPILTPMRKLVPALTFGNAMILKPSEFTPGTAMIIQEAANATLPQDLLQVVVGGAELGKTLTENPGIQAISFTGSVAVGKKVYAAAATTLAEVNLELGGKNPAILHDATNLDAALDQIYGAAMMCAGQRCTAISRVIVQKNLAKATVDGLVKRANAAVVGDGLTDGVTIGPLTTKDQHEKVTAFVERAVAEGAIVSAGGGVPTTNTGGYFYSPTILDKVTPDMEIAKEEVFGPVISVLTYQSLEEALSVANDVAYGLTSALFSEQPSVIDAFVNQSQSGMVHVNHGTVPDNHMPFVGIKESGVGVGSVGASAISFYTTEHAIYLKPKA